MTRLTKEQLNKLMKKENVDRLWSYSRINCFLTSHFEYFLSYVVHAKKDRDDCIYGVLGGAAHQCLEDYYTGKIPYEKMIEQFEDSWLMNRDITQLKFDRNDAEKDIKIAERYHENLKHFFTHHKVMNGNPLIEKFIKIRIGNHLLQGYIDCITKDEDGIYTILDFKTSTEYKGKTLEEHSAQLVLYALGLMQAGVDINKLRIGFNFLKYCSVEVAQKNNKKKVRSIERYKLGESLCSSARMWLKDAGYSEDEIDFYLKALIDANDIYVLPDEVQEKFSISDHYVYIPLTQKLIDKWVDVVETTIKDIVLREKDYEETKNIKCFWDDEESVKAQSYYYATLCSYSPSKLLPYKEYLEKLEDQKNNQSLFGGLLGDSVNSSNDALTSKDICDNSNKDNDELDLLLWLDDIL